MIHEEHLLPAISSYQEEIPALNRWIEEADSRLIVHIEWALVVDKSKRILVISNDADTFALLLYYIPHYLTLGLEEIWQQYGT